MGDAVAVAGGLHQFFASDNFYPAALVLDEAGALQHAGGEGDGGSLRAEHLGEKFLGQLEDVVLDAFLHHEEPSRQTSLCFVEFVAGGDLAHGHALLLYELEDAGANLRRVKERCLEI